jgi:membrane protein YdbS with pleckstrin-like domain
MVLMVDKPRVQLVQPATPDPPSQFGGRQPRPQLRERLDPRAVRAWRVEGAISSLAWLLLAIGIGVLFWWLDQPFYIVALPLVPAGMAGLVHVWLVPSVRWRRWYYAVTEREVDLQHGLLVVTRTLVPMTRVQHVDTRQGPILRHYGLATVQIATAAGTQQIPALAVEVAESLRDRIAALAGVADDV